MRPARLHLLAATGVVALTVAVAPFAGAPSGDAGAEGAQQELLDEGRNLYETNCSSCHGADGGGREETDGGAGGPSLQDAGEASAFFYLSTGRMPLANADEQPIRKPPGFSDEQIDALVAYVASLGEGPELPVVDPDDGDLAQGGVIYRANCQACHSASGNGGALSYGRAAPKLGPATTEEIAAAVRTGPGQMPVFGNEVVSDQGLDDLIRYVEYLDNPEDPGGLPIGRTGPIPEGFVAWLVGMVALIACIFWIGTRNPVSEGEDDGEDDDGDDDDDEGEGDTEDAATTEGVGG